jgi:uncharacterized protein YjbJ (UPF0337 family)
MNWDMIQGRWKELKGSARQQWGRLTDDELERAAGDREKLAGLIQERYGQSKEQAHQEVDSWMERQV